MSLGVSAGVFELPAQRIALYLLLAAKSDVGNREVHTREYGLIQALVEEFF